MANLFVVCLPVEEEDEDEARQGDKLFDEKVHKETVSNPDMPETFKPLKKATMGERCEEAEETEGQSETHPLLGAGEVVGRFLKSRSNDSIDQMNKKESSLKTSASFVNSSKVIPGSRFQVSEVPPVEYSAGDSLENGTINKEMVMEGEDVMSQEVMSLREFLEDKLVRKLEITSHVWQKSSDDAHWMVTFLVPKELCDSIYNTLTLCGFGWIPGTSISVFETGVHKEGHEISKRNAEVPKSKFNSDKEEFVKSIKSSLTVAQVVGDISNNSKLTFDFLILIFLASMIAGFGLAENSSVVLVASMLISPLMGPIIGFTFGIVVNNTQLCILALKTELIGLGICLAYGFIFGLITAGIEASSLNYSVDAVWPTTEMVSRGLYRSLWVGVFVALPSGAGVALAILGGNTGSLVGVAISASLLPPVVNAGMFWGLAFISAAMPPQLEAILPLHDGNSSSGLSTAAMLSSSQIVYPPNCPLLKDNGYRQTYSCCMWEESIIMGCLSLLLAILNIVCIFIMGTLVMKIKEISPLPGANRTAASFWKKDLNLYRRAYETVKGDKIVDMGNMAKTLTSLIKANPKAKENVEEVISSVRKEEFFKSISDPNLFIDGLMDLKSAEEQDRTPKVEFKLHDNVYKTVGGCMAKVSSNRLSAIFETPVRDLSGVPLSPISPVANHLKAGGGCVRRLRRTQSHARPFTTTSMETPAVFGNILQPQFSTTEEEDEVQMIDLDYLAKHQRKSKFLKGIATPTAV